MRRTSVRQPQPVVGDVVQQIGRTVIQQHESISALRRVVALPIAARVGLAGMVFLAAAALPHRSAAAEPVHPRHVAALTHHNDGIGKQVTYRSPMSVVLSEADLPDGAWTLKEDQTTVLCFQDGNNAVFFTIGDEFYAANGKARQFVDFDDGDGIVLDSGKLLQVHELKPGLHSQLRQLAIDTGLKLCGQKPLDEVTEAVNAASEKPVMSQHQAVMLTMALAVRGAELCRFQLDAVAVVDYLQANDIDRNTFGAELPVYSIVVTKMFNDVGAQDFCHTVLLPRFGPGGKKFVSE